MVDVNQENGINNVGFLELTGKSPEDLSGISYLENVGVILVPESLHATLMKIPQKNVGLIVTVPITKGKIKVLSGQLTLSGDVFSNLTGSPEDILVIVGQVIISSPIEAVGFSEVIVAGQLFAPKSQESKIASTVSRMVGQIAYYTGDVPRIFIGDETFSQDFFELIDSKMSLILIGSCEISEDVDIAILKQKIADFIIIGDITVSRKLAPLIQILATTKLGDILIREDEDQAG
ncbi:hypothetical protein [Paenibacillus terrigena]|uniref:hypothetical protein n=1 Tax=Paenibacillus terrigena TaxID=369333 RepID=UPI0028D47B6F|nr:hypothetical protein [Paenibacillus terrigena]